jgi:hypothetical protein
MRALGLVGLTVGFFAVLPLACREGGANIGLVMSTPQGVLDEATSVKLSVFPAAGHSCAADGGVGDLPSEDLLDFSLSQGSCSGSATWCGEITLERGDEPQMFYVEVSGDAGLLAQGCATAVIDKDPVEVGITVVRFVEPACCGDGIVQSTELCDEGGDDSCGGTTASATCSADCTTPVQLLDDDGVGSPAATGQGHLGITFAPGDDQLDDGLRAAWNWGEAKDIGLRILQSDLSPVTDPESLELARRVYFRCTGMTALATRDQDTPSITALGNGAAISFRSSEAVPLQFDAVALAMNDKGCSDAQEATLMSDGESSVDDVDIASGPAGTALVVWEQNGRILGRTFDGTDAGDNTITISDDGAAPRVAGYNAGWVVVYQGPAAGDNDGVVLKRVTTSLGIGSPVLVNAGTNGVQDQADVGMVSDGSAAVAFRSGGNIFFQRFLSSDAKIAGDQDAPLAVSPAADEAAPAVAGAASGDFFVVAWQTGNQIRARFAGKAEGFLFNNVTGQNDDFDATINAGAGAPRAPTIATGDIVVIGWEDQSAAVPGVLVRRFPLPN